MLGSTLACKTPLILALDATEEAVPVDSAQVQEQSIKLCVLALNFRLQLLKGKLDFFFHVEHLFDEALAKVNITRHVVECHLRGHFRRLHSLVVLDRCQFEVFRLVAIGSLNYDRFEQGDRSFCFLLGRVDKPSEALEVVHLQGPAEDDLLESSRHGCDSFFELDTGHEDWHLLQVERSTIRVKLVMLGSIHWRVVSLGQVEQAERDLGCKLTCFLFYQGQLVKFDLIYRHRVVCLHEPRLFLVLAVKGLRVVLTMLFDVLLVLATESGEVVGLTRLQTRELLLRNERLAHRREEETFFVVLSIALGVWTATIVRVATRSALETSVTWASH